MPAVSICIPAYKRPELLRLAVKSCLAQTFTDFEIIMGVIPGFAERRNDRSAASDSVYPVLSKLTTARQAKNVNQLFAQAQGEFLVLLHDDDILQPNALEALIRPLQQNPDLVASFGKQLVINSDGDVLQPESESLNRKYCRTDQRANRVQRSAWAALVQQLPCDGYMVRTAAARATYIATNLKWVRLATQISAIG